MANGVLGYLAMAFADVLGLPPHLNFLVLVVWFLALGVAWWRAPAEQDGRSDETLAVEGSRLGA